MKHQLADGDWVQGKASGQYFVVSIYPGPPGAPERILLTAYQELSDPREYFYVDQRHLPKRLPTSEECARTRGLAPSKRFVKDQNGRMQRTDLRTAPTAPRTAVDAAQTGAV